MRVSSLLHAVVGVRADRRLIVVHVYAAIFWVRGTMRAMTLRHRDARPGPSSTTRNWYRKMTGDNS
ncbi:MAG: hypothetical protein MZW92_73365 [Comamonadaceae bacterium]|nr:hypothetical protein [Comamonadaceae bacterium]